MEYCSTLRKKEISPLFINWEELEGIMLSKTSQTKTIPQVSLYVKPKKRSQTHRLENWLPKAGDRRNKEKLVKGCKFSVIKCVTRVENTVLYN